MSQEDNATVIDKGTGKPVVSAVPEPACRPLAVSPLRRAFRGRLGTAVGLILFGIIFTLVWEGVFRLGIISRFIIPSAFKTLREIVRIFGDVFTGGSYLESTWITIEEIAVGFALGAVAGIVLGLIIGETAFGRRVLMPYVVGFNAMPKVAFAPLFVAALGFGLAPKILMAAVIAFFPIVVNTATGIESASDNELMLFRAIEASRWKTLWKLKFPTSLPFVFAGLKIAAVLAVIGAVVADILSGGAGGLGKAIIVASTDLRTATVFALIVLLSIVGLIVYMIVVVAEHYIVHWRQPKWRRK
jgi:NitT/TauT family transport system permease protein